MLPDTGERYQSTALFEDISVDMNEAELSLSLSTPSCHFEVTTCPVKLPPAPAPMALDPAAERFVDQVTTTEPIVMFALEWCEFSWSVRKFFTALGVKFHSVDLDSVAFQEQDRGGKIRAVLKHRIGSNNIPQVYVAGQLIGGCTDLFNAWSDGRLAKLLRSAGVGFDERVNVDPWALLPKWVHPRRIA
jgi:cysteine synthase A